MQLGFSASGSREATIQSRRKKWLSIVSSVGLTLSVELAADALTDPDEAEPPERRPADSSHAT